MANTNVYFLKKYDKDVYPQVCSKDFSWVEGCGGCRPQELGPELNNVRIIGYASFEDTTSDQLKWGRL